MKSPTELRHKLARQWHNANLRESRLLQTSHWPLSLNIGKPSPQLVVENPAALREHICQWQTIDVGEVHWKTQNYRDTSAPLSIPERWILHSPSDWIGACENESLHQEFSHFASIVEASDPIFHQIILRQRSLAMARDAEQIILASQVALKLSPGMAAGKPLRALSIAGCDSKFFERNRALLILMLSVRFGEAVRDQGLDAFLGAAEDKEHWLLLASLQDKLLPFQQMRVRAGELMTRPLPASLIVVVENEKCLHQLPPLPDTIAILGAGLNLSWLKADWLQQKQVLYWGDIDTWGFSMLATARRHLPQIIPVLMTQAVFDQYAEHSAVIETTSAGDEPPDGLSKNESQLYNHLLRQEKGRLEQEFIPESLVHSIIDLSKKNTTL